MVGNHTFHYSKIGCMDIYHFLHVLINQSTALFAMCSFLARENKPLLPT